MLVSICHLQVMRIGEISNAHPPVLPPIAASQMGTNTLLSRGYICILTVIENHQLDSTEQRFDRIVVGAAFGQAHPMEPQLVHLPPGLARLAWVSGILISGDPYLLVGIPAAHLLHALTDIF